MTSSSSEKSSSGKKGAKKGKQGSAKQDALPFEPKSFKSAKKTAKAPAVPRKKNASSKQGGASRKKSVKVEGVPEVVSRRMAKRMVVFCGIPTLLGIAVLPTSYLLISREIVALPNTAVLLVSMLCLGLSVVGLTYGVLSASWDEDQPGTLLGIQEFQINLQRFRESWKNRN